VGASACSSTVSAAMKDAPASIPGRRVDHLADLVVTKVVRNLFPPFPPVAGLTQQETLQSFIQGDESVLWCKLGDLAEFLKGEVMAEDRPCCQEVTCRGRKSGGAALDHLAHIRGKHAVRWSGFEDEGCGSNTQPLPSIKRGTRTPCSSSS